MLLDAPSEPNVLLDLNNWWVERRVNCREALNAGPGPHRLRDRREARARLGRRLYRGRVPRRLDRAQVPRQPERRLAPFRRAQKRRDQLQEHRARRILARANLARARRPGVGHHPLPQRRQVPAIFLRPARPPGARRQARASRGHLDPAADRGRHPALPVARHGARHRHLARGRAGRRRAAILPRALPQAREPARGRAAGRARQADGPAAARAPPRQDRLQPRLCRSATTRFRSASSRNSGACSATASIPPWCMRCRGRKASSTPRPRARSAPAG